jgi:precorrin-6B methylase 2
VSDDVSVRFTVAGLETITGFSPEQIPWLDITGLELLLDVGAGAASLTVAGTAPRERLGEVVRIAQESLASIRGAKD